MVDINSVLDSNTMHLLPAAIKEKKKRARSGGRDNEYYFRFKSMDRIVFLLFLLYAYTS